RVWAVRPCVTAFRRERHFPLGLRGPVLRIALARLALSFSGLIIAGVPSRERSRAASSHPRNPGRPDPATPLDGLTVTSRLYYTGTINGVRDEFSCFFLQISEMGSVTNDSDWTRACSRATLPGPAATEGARRWPWRWSRGAGSSATTR